MSKDINNITSGRSASEVRSMMTTHRTTVVKKRKAEEKKKVLPPIQKASDLIGKELPLPPEQIAGLLYRGSTMIYGGGSKTNKTFAMMDMAVSVATGTPWWDLKTAKGRVLYLDFELQQAFFRERLDKIANAKGTTVEALQDIDVWNLRGYAADLSDIVDQIIERIKDTSYALIVIDPIYKVMGDRDENSAGDINSLMNELDKLAVASGASIVVGHHFSKGNQAGKESMDRISGSGVFGRAPDAIMIITKHEQDDVYTVETTLRNHKTIEPFCVQWSYPLMVRSPLHDPAKLKVLGRKKEEFPADILLKYLEEGALTTTEWKQMTIDGEGMSDGTFGAKKRKLVAEKRVIQDGEKWRMPLIAQPPINTAQEKRVQSATSAIAPIAA